MAVTSYGTNAPNVVKLFSRKLFREALKTTKLAPFMGEGSGNLIQVMTDTNKGPGDKITFQLRMQLNGAGTAGDGTLEGNEEALTVYTDSFVIDQLRHAVRSGGKMSDQRIPFSVREEARLGLTDWWADRLDQVLINQLTGATQSDLRYAGNNATIAPSSTRVVYPLANEASEASISTSSTFSLFQVDKAVARAKTMTPVMRPINKDGYDYVAFIHPFQTLALRQSAGVAGSWGDITRAMLQGGQSLDRNMYGNGALGIFNRTLLVEDARMPLITTMSGGTGRRAVLCGAQAAVLAVGQNYSTEKMSWVEELFDYENQLGVAAGCIFGAKKSVFNSIDLATITMPSTTNE